MKKLGKLTLKEFAGGMQLIDKNDQKCLLGGTEVTRVDINGGYVVSYNNQGDGDNYSVFYGSDGTQIVFDGVTTDRDNIMGNAYQLSGIHVGAGPTVFFSIEDMIHEYGHYLEQQMWGLIPYTEIAGSTSLYGFAANLSVDDYYNLPSEQLASLLGQAYMNNYYPNNDYTATGL